MKIKDLIEENEYLKSQVKALTERVTKLENRSRMITIEWLKRTNQSGAGKLPNKHQTGYINQYLIQILGSNILSIGIYLLGHPVMALALALIWGTISTGLLMFREKVLKELFEKEVQKVLDGPTVEK